MPRSPLEKKKKDFLKLLWRDEGGENPLITVSFVEPATICHLSLLKLLHIQIFFQYFVYHAKSHVLGKSQYISFYIIGDNVSEIPNLHFVGSAEPMPNHDLSGRTDAEP